MAQIASMIATEVTGIARTHFTFQLFGERHFWQGESCVYTWMGKLCSEYNGGCWNFYQAPNGAMFMAPDTTEVMHLTWEMNWSDERISAGAAGIVATLFALNTLINVEGSDELIERYYALRDFASDHPEGPAIFKLID